MTGVLRLAVVTALAGTAVTVGAYQLAAGSSSSARSDRARSRSTSMSTTRTSPRIT